MITTKRTYPTVHQENFCRLTVCWHVPENYREMVGLIDDEFKGSVELMAKDSQREFGGRLSDLALKWDLKKGLYEVVTGENNSGIYLDNRAYKFRDIRVPVDALNVINIISRYLNGLESRMQSRLLAVESRSDVYNFDCVKSGFSQVPQLEVTG